MREKDKELGILRAYVDELIEWKVAMQVGRENTFLSPNQYSLKQTPLASGQLIFD